MRKMITRTITRTTIESVNVSFVGGKMESTPNPLLTVAGVVSEEKALKVARKTYGNSCQVVTVASIDEIYEISVEDFVKHAKKVVVVSDPTS